jgi:cation-transporting ATPase 13A1
VVLAACNGIVVVDGELVGESMEVMGLKASGWVMSRPDVYREQKGRRRQLSVVHRFPFASSLARMSVVCDVTEGGGNRSGIVLCKGAPETVRALLAQVPAAYEHVYKKYAREGKRVLALATKPFDNSARGKVNREDVESGLSFVGFVVYHCPLKAQSAPSIRELTAAGHHVVMITGDQILTACHVARQLGITRRSSSLILESVDEGKHVSNLPSPFPVPAPPSRPFLGLAPYSPSCLMIGMPREISPPSPLVTFLRPLEFLLAVHDGARAPRE